MGCDDTALVSRCADKVMALHRNHSAYMQMLEEPWIHGDSELLLRELAGWHPALARANDTGDNSDAGASSAFSGAALARRLGDALRARSRGGSNVP